MQELQPTRWRRIIMLLPINVINVVLMGRDNREYQFKSQVKPNFYQLYEYIYAGDKQC